MMKTILSRASLLPLLETTRGPCISLFLPTDRTNVERPQDQLRIRRLIREADGLIRDKTQLHSAQVEELLEPLRTLLDDRGFWQHLGDGLAIFRSPEMFHPLRLPYSFKERVVVGNHFSFKPLLPLLSDDGSFYVLAISHNAVRLLACTHESASELKLPKEVPTSLAAFLGGEERENDLQAHSSASFGVVGKGGRHPAIIHGQGIGIDDEKNDTLRYFQQIDRGLHEVFRDETTPLVLAGVEYLFPIYREANTYPHLLEQGVGGNPDRLSAEALRAKAWPIVESVVLQARELAAMRYRDLAGTGRASSQISEIVPAASYGQVASLFVTLDQEQWGTFDPSSGRLEIHEQPQPGDEDLLDLAVIQTLRHAGEVYAVEQSDMPPFAAAFRYAPTES
jgi:hypothetical protein